MKQFLKLFSLVFLIIFSACRPDSFVSIHRDIPQLPVVSAILETDSVVRVSIQLSDILHEGGKSLIDSLRKGEVYFSMNGTRQKLTRLEGDHSIFVPQRVVDFRLETLRIPKIRPQVSLDIEIPGFPPGQSTISDFTPTSEAELISIDSVSAFHSFPRSDKYSTKIKMQIRPGTSKSYFLMLSYLHEYLVDEELVINPAIYDFNINLPYNAAFYKESQDVDLKEYQQMFPYKVYGFTSEDLNAGTNNVEISFAHSSSSLDIEGVDDWYHYFVVHEVDKATFDFYATSSYQELISHLPLSEPIQIPSNISNAIGIFGHSHPVLTIPLNPGTKAFLESRNKKAVVNN